MLFLNYRTTQDNKKFPDNEMTLNDMTIPDMTFQDMTFHEL